MHVLVHFLSPTSEAVKIKALAQETHLLLAGFKLMPDQQPQCLMPDALHRQIYTLVCVNSNHMVDLVSVWKNATSVDVWGHCLLLTMVKTDNNMNYSPV